MSDWSKKAVSHTTPPEVTSRIDHLRRLMLVHSCIYYELDNNVVTDHQWQDWANELAELQSKHGWLFGFYDEAFQDWNGSTGHRLPMRDFYVLNKARTLLLQQQRITVKDQL